MCVSKKFEGIFINSLGERENERKEEKSKMYPKKILFFFVLFSLSLLKSFSGVYRL
jgi:hypothetical protein